MSVLLRPPLDSRQLYLATAAVALSTAAACRRAAGVEALCKWPNDLVVDDRKLAGVLAEVDLGESGGGPVGKDPAVVVGVGLNVTWPGPPGAGGTSLLEVTGQRVDRRALRELVLQELEERRRALDDEAGRSGILAELRALSATLGRPVRVERAGSAVGGVVQGQAVDLTDAGNLLLETATGRVELSVGDVVHLRPARGSVP
jgi:BirA family transcriptional regulator, biotin operon repressor / biotin---[acetyl-CoA-carboxylase] ligase